MANPTAQSAALARLPTDRPAPRVSAHHRHEAGATEALNRTSCRSALWLEYLNVHLARRQFLPTGIDADALDILLALDVARFEGRTLSATDAGLVTGLPATTSLRRLQFLDEAGFILRLTDAKDRRRLLLTLTPTGLAIVQSTYQRIFAVLDPA